jgi:uncharacterized iron-regulated membrane protein
MKADIVRIYKSVHTWTGIISGMALFIAFYAGALTVFKEPITRWATPPSAASVVPLEAAQPLILKILEADPATGRNFTIQLREVEHVLSRMEWQVRDPDADDHDDTATRYYGATLDTAGNARIDEIHPSALAEFIDVLHRVVGLPTDSDHNRWVMGVIAVLYGVALISGVIVLLPSLIKDFFALRVGKNLKRMWLDAHNVVGIISLPFHIVMAVTSVVFAYHDLIYEMQDWLVHDGKWAQAFPSARNRPDPPSTQNPSNMLTPMQLVQAAQGVSPGFAPTMLQYQQVTAPRAVVRVWGKDSTAVSPRARGGFIALNPYTGAVISKDYMPGHQSPPNMLISSFFALHMAAFGNTAVLWMYFLLGMAGAWLFYSGNLLWVETRRKKASRQTPGVPEQRLDTRLMASATVGVCLGCICGISLTIVTSKWLHDFGADLRIWHQIVYYAVFFGCIAWAFWRGAARAGIHLLWTASAATVSIPMTTLIAWLVPATGLWVHSSLAALSVDLVAFIGAFCFALMAQAAARRVARGTVDSVWSDGRQSVSASQAQKIASTCRSANLHDADPLSG